MRVVGSGLARRVRVKDHGRFEMRSRVTWSARNIQTAKNYFENEVVFVVFHRSRQ